MNELFSGNGFNVLGLSTSASQKEINRRAKELVNLLKIDEVPEYTDDIQLIQPIRTENSVKSALQKLTSPTKRINEYFFWFDKSNASDESAFDKLSDKGITDVITAWHETADSGESAKAYIAKRNLAVLLSVLVATGKKQYIARSVRTWHELIDSDKFWASFIKIYQLNDELGTSAEAINSFKNVSIEELANYYADLSKDTSDGIFVAEFQKTFKVKGGKVEKDILAPIFSTINDASAQLKDMKFDEENIVSKQKLSELKSLIVKLRNSFDKLKELGFYNDSQSKTMRDKAAEAMRSVGLDLYNNLNDAGKSGSILKIAVEICGTPTLKSRLEDDLADLKRLVGRDKVILPINSLLEADDFEGALNLIEDAMQTQTSNIELQEILLQRLKWGITGMAAAQYASGKELYDKNKFTEAKNILANNVEFLLNYLEYTDINREYVDNVLTSITNLSNNLGKSQTSGTDVENLRNGVVEQTEQHFKDQFEGTILMLMVDSALYANLAEKIPVLKRKKTIKSWLTTAAVILFFIIVGAANSNSSNSASTPSTGTSSGSSSTASSAYNDCVTQYNNLKSQLDSINTQEDNYKASGATDNYNALVPQQNDLVNQVNNKATECNGLR
jgi:hypothetical protein